jgi:hypothetical protein
MLVVHWAKHNTTPAILANGIRPTFRHNRGGGRKNPKGVYVYPFSSNKTLSSNWRRNLKRWDRELGNYNGFVFRLQPDDFPLIAGYWFDNRSDPERTTIDSPQALTDRFGEFFSGTIVDKQEGGLRYNWEDFEIIIPRHIHPKRIIKVLRDREPVKMER